MSKTKISEFSTTPGNNTDINGINISEGCPPSGINNAIRELMSDLKEWQSGAMDVYVIPQGTAAAPGIQLYGDLDTGLYGFAANQLGVAVGGASAGYFSSAGWVGNVVATTVDLTNIEVTNIKAKDGTAAITIADSTGVVSVSTQLAIDNLNLSGNTLSSSDTNGNIILAPNGTGDVYIDADTIRVGDSNTNVTITSNGTADLILNTNSGTNSGSITIEDGVNGNIIIAPNGTGQVQITNAALDLTTIEVTNIKARDGTAAASIADSTGVMTIASSVLTTTDINGGTIDGAVIGGSSAAAGTFTTITGTQVNSDNLRLDGNTLSSTDANGNIIIAPDGIGQVHISNTVAVGLYQEIASNSRTPGVTSLQVGQGASGEAYVVNRANNYLVLGANGAERARISANGVFRIKGAGTAGTSDAVVINQSAPTDSFVINASGQVGIGTSPTSSTLTVSAAGASQTLISTTGTNAASSSFSNTGGTVGVGINSSAATPAYAAYISHSGTYPISFYTDSVERARINSDGILSGWSGTNSAPTFSYTNDPNTGMYFPAADAVGFATGGTEIVRITSTGLQVTNIKAKDGTAALSIADSTGVVSVSANPVLSGGTANGVLYLNGSKVATSDANLTYNGSVFAVGTGANTRIVDAVGASNGVSYRLRNWDIIGCDTGTGLTLGGLTGSQWTNLQVFTSGTEKLRITSGGQVNIGGNFTSTNNTLQVTGNAAIGYTTAAPTTGLIVAGNVGVGTDNPAQKLDVQGAGTIYASVTNTTSGSGSARLKLFNNGETSDGFALINNAGASGQVNILNYKNSPLAFWTNSTERLHLDSSGNLGLGAAPGSPAYGYTRILDVAGQFPGIKFTPSGASTFGFQIGAGTGGFQFYDVAASSERMRIDSNGDLAIGRTAVTKIGSGYRTVDLDDTSGSGLSFRRNGTAIGYIYVDASGLQYSATSTNPHIWYTAGTEKARITSGGDFVVGATSASSRLEAVAGTGAQDIARFRTGDATAANNAGGGFYANSSATAASRYAYMWLDADGANFSGLDYFSIYKAGNSGHVEITNSSNSFMSLGTNNTERARITSGGYFKASNSGTYLDATGTYHELRQSASVDTVFITNTNASPTNMSVITSRYTGASPNNTTTYFLYCSDGGSTVRANIRSNGGLANYQSNNVDLSDIRTKTDINPLGSYWNKIAALEIVTYKYKDQTHDDLNIGVIAQQVEQVAPEFVDPDGFGETPEDGVPLKTIYNKDLTFAAIKALQEAMARIEKLEAEVAALKGV